MSLAPPAGNNVVRIQSDSLRRGSEGWWVPWATLAAAGGLGLWMAVWPATFFVALLTVVLALAIATWTPTEDRRFLLTAFCLSIALRWALASALVVGGVKLGWGDDLFGDVRSYFRLGAYLAGKVTGEAYWTAVHPSVLDLDNLNYIWNYYHVTFKGGYPTKISLLNLWTYLCGGIFAWFGYSPLAMQWLSGTLMSVAAVCFYHVALPVGGRRPARLAAGLYLLWPSIILWSATGLLEGMTHAMIWAIWLGLRTALQNRRLRWLLWIVLGSLGLFYLLRPEVFLIFLLAVVPLEILTAWRVTARKGRRLQTLGVFLLCGVLVAGTIGLVAKYTYRGTGENMLYSLVARQRGGAHFRGTNIYIYPERFYNVGVPISGVAPLTAVELGVAYLRGLAYVIFAPFPWRAATYLQIAALPQTLLWSVLCGISVMALLTTRYLRERFLLPLLGFTFLFATVMALAESNVGTMFRHRDLLVPVVLVLSSLLLAPEASAREEDTDTPLDGRGKTAVLFISYNGVLEPILQSQGLPYMRGVAARGVKVVLLTFERPATAMPERLDALRLSLGGAGITWIALKYHKWPRLLATVYDITRGAKEAAKLVRRYDIGIIHARSYIPAIVAWLVVRRRKVPWIFDMRGLMAEEYADGGLIGRYGLLYRAIKLIERRLLRDSDHVVVLTDAVRDILLDDKRIWNSKNHTPISVIPCCTDLELFTPGPEARRHPTEAQAEGLHFIYIGSVGTWYCLDEMIAFMSAAKERWPGTRWTILTHGNHDAVRASLREGGLPLESVTLRAVLPQEVPAELAAADVGIAFILPSGSKLASSPTKIGEYLACGLPVVINSGIGDTESLIERHRVGVVVKSLEHSAYCGALLELEQLLQDPGLKARCREAAEKDLALSMGVERYTNVYEQLGASLNS